MPLDLRNHVSATGIVCQRCGTCCHGPGDVILTHDEATRIAAQMNLDVYDFTAQYTRLLAGRAGLSLTERADGACIFLTADNRCRIQDTKPLQCRSFPFIWRSERLANQCPGLQKAGDNSRAVAAGQEPEISTEELRDPDSNFLGGPF